MLRRVALWSIVVGAASVPTEQIGQRSRAERLSELRVLDSDATAPADAALAPTDAALAPTDSASVLHSVLDGPPVTYTAPAPEPSPAPSSNSFGDADFQQWAGKTLPSLASPPPTDVPENLNANPIALTPLGDSAVAPAPLGDAANLVAPAPLGDAATPVAPAPLGVIFHKAKRHESTTEWTSAPSSNPVFDRRHPPESDTNQTLSIGFGSSRLLPSLESGSQNELDAWTVLKGKHASCTKTLRMDFKAACNRTIGANQNPRLGTTPYYNNLNGKGPNANDSHEILFKNVGTFSHLGPYSGALETRKLDLHVKAFTEKYTPAQATANGCGGGPQFGQINLGAGDEVKLQFSLRDSLKGLPVVPESFYFSIFDFDGGEDERIKEWLYINKDQYDAFELDQHSEIKVRS